MPANFSDDSVEGRVQDLEKRIGILERTSQLDLSSVSDGNGNSVSLRNIAFGPTGVSRTPPYNLVGATTGFQPGPLSLPFTLNAGRLIVTVSCSLAISPASNVQPFGGMSYQITNATTGAVVFAPTTAVGLFSSGTGTGSVFLESSYTFPHTSGLGTGKFIITDAYYSTVTDSGAQLVLSVSNMSIAIFPF